MACFELSLDDISQQQNTTRVEVASAFVYIVSSVEAGSRLLFTDLEKKKKKSCIINFCSEKFVEKKCK